MELTLSLSLPRDALSIPLVRRVLRRSMQVLGVEEQCGHDIETAVTEACTNVLDHTMEGDAYSVTCTVDDDLCVIQVVDTGHGFDAELLGIGDAEQTAEQGRGIQLIRALTDRVRFENRPERGTIVHLEKTLEWSDGAPARRLARGDAGPGGG